MRRMGRGLRGLKLGFSSDRCRSRVFARGDM